MQIDSYASRVRWLIAAAATTLAFVASAQPEICTQQPNDRCTDTEAELCIPLWPGGRIPYRFDDDIEAPDRATVEGAMRAWEQSVANAVRFQSCATCEDPFLRIRYNRASESSQGCSRGLRRQPGENGSSHRMRVPKGISDQNARHELGHCIGLTHEHERSDWRRWLKPQGGWMAPSVSQRFLPVLGNYEYDSVMHYRSCSGTTLRFTDLNDNHFGRSEYIARGDVSRVLQYYACVRHPKWGFFESLADVPRSGSALPDPYLAPRVEAVGSPAVAHFGGEDFDVFALGTDRQMYWRSFRGGRDGGSWRSLGCCAGSDPAAVSRQPGEIDLFFIGADSGRLVWTRYANGAWNNWRYPLNRVPAGGLRRDSSDRYLGPAAASRGTDKLDVFVVRTDGRLASIHLDGDRWRGWTTQQGAYEVVARPAAVAQSETLVRLAIHTAGRWLYEPQLTLRGDAPRRFDLGQSTGRLGHARNPPALAKRADARSPFRVVAINERGHLAHRFAGSERWEEVGGLVSHGTGPAAVAAGNFGAILVINGEPAARSCTNNCYGSGPCGTPGDFERAQPQPGGLWLRRFH
jgi:hypothetical protein